MLSAVAKVLKTVTGGGKVVTQAVGQAAASGLANGLTAGTRIALLEATQGTVRTIAKGTKESVSQAAAIRNTVAAVGVIGGLNAGARVAVFESTKSTARAATHAAKQGGKELGEELADVIGEVPKSLINAVGLGGAASAGVGISARATAKAAKATTSKAMDSLNVPKPVGALPAPLKEIAKETAVQTTMVGAELLNSSYEGVVQGGMTMSQKVKSGIIGGGG